MTEVETYVKQVLSPARRLHVEHVVRTAEKLAATQGADVEKCRLAAWLHDVAKEYDRDESLKLAKQFGIIFTELELRIPELWHGPLGAELARRRFGITDGDVLAAIRYHTTGRPGMSLVEQVVFLADVIEPGREFPGVERLRALSETDFHGALLATLDETVLWLVGRGGLLHPDTVAARNELLVGMQDG